MKLVVHTSPGKVELAYTWLPTWLGMNSAIHEEIGQALRKKLVGLPITEKTLDDAHDMVIDFLVERFPGIAGLRDCLDSIKYVSFGNEKSEEVNVSP